MLQTKFKLWAYVPLIISVCLTVLLAVFVRLFSVNLPTFAYLLILFLLALIIWLVTIELKNKAVLVKIEEKEIKLIKFLGWGSQTSISIESISGYKISQVPHEWDSSEVLYLIVNNKKAIRISEFYHQNYYDIKLYLTRRFKNLGSEPYTLFS